MRYKTITQDNYNDEGIIDIKNGVVVKLIKDDIQALNKTIKDLTRNIKELKCVTLMLPDKYKNLEKDLSNNELRLFINKLISKSVGISECERVSINIVICYGNISLTKTATEKVKNNLIQILHRLDYSNVKILLKNVSTREQEDRTVQLVENINHDNLKLLLDMSIIKYKYYNLENDQDKLSKFLRDDMNNLVELIYNTREDDVSKQLLKRFNIDKKVTI